MKRFSVIVSIFLLAIAATDAAPIVFVVRHAEKASTGGDDPDLSAAGHKRADALARVLKDSQITAIFVTELKRTQETAVSLAKETHTTPTVIPAKDIPALVMNLRTLNGNALVVSHGNTIPDLLKALGIATSITIPENDYTEIFLVSLTEPPQLLRLHYPF
jgi:broad specificity phosphatase PhoE